MLVVYDSLYCLRKPIKRNGRDGGEKGTGWQPKRVSYEITEMGADPGGAMRADPGNEARDGESLKPLRYLMYGPPGEAVNLKDSPRQEGPRPLRPVIAPLVCCPHPLPGRRRTQPMRRMGFAGARQGAYDRHRM